MKLFTIVFLLFTFCITNAQEFFGFEYTNSRVRTGSSPSQIFDYSYAPIVYCSGIDKNFNGVKDEGDESPSLWILPVILLAAQQGQYISDSYKLTELEFNIPMVPARNYYDKTTSRFYFINSNSIDTGSFVNNNHNNAFITGRLIDDFPNVFAVSSYQDLLFLSVRNSMESGRVIIYNITTKQFTDTINAGAGVQMTQFLDDGDALIILSEGNFGKNDGKLQVAMFQDNDSLSILEYPVGGTPNHFYYSEQLLKILVTCNASNEILAIDLKNQSIDTIRLNLPAYDGPRESVMFPSVNGLDFHIFTTAYSGNVYIFDESGDSVTTVDAYGKAESCLAVGNSDFVIVTPFQTGTYTPDTAVTIYSRPMSVNENAAKKIRIYPNPAINSFSLDVLDNLIISGVEIVNALGITVVEFKNVASLKNIRFELTQGMYFVRVKHNQGLTTLPMSVVE